MKEKFCSRNSFLFINNREILEISLDTRLGKNWRIRKFGFKLNFYNYLLRMEKIRRMDLFVRAEEIDRQLQK